MAIAPDTARAEWSLKATSACTGKPYVRRGTETILFTPQGLIAEVTVEDR